jgi:NADH:ubiquinone oxidoreductase subunit E
LAPVVAIGGEVHGKTSSIKIKKIINKLRKKEQAQ